MRIHQKDRDAVSYSDAHEDSRDRGHMAICFGPEANSFGRSIMDEDLLPMRLPGLDHAGESVAASQAHPVLPPFRGSLGSEEPKIPTGRPGAPTCGPLNEPGEPLSPLRVSPGKGRCDSGRNGPCSRPSPVHRVSSIERKRHRTRSLRDEPDRASDAFGIFHGSNLPAPEPQDPGW